MCNGDDLRAAVAAFGSSCCDEHVQQQDDVHSDAQASRALELLTSCVVTVEELHTDAHERDRV